MEQKYLIRLDDASPTMSKEKWGRIEEILDQYGVKPMVGVIPHNEDPEQLIAQEDLGFWSKVKEWEKKGWTIAMHGYNHCYASDEGMKGLNPIWKRSEFAGLSLEVQKKKIRQGVFIMRNNDVNPKYFFAPSHTFDENTLEALRKESDIRVVSDTIGRYPYKHGDFYLIPQILGHCAKMPFGGVYTFCFHPNTMKERAFVALESFLKANKEHFISFEEINFSRYGNKKMLDRLLSWAFFFYRRVRGLR